MELVNASQMQMFRTPTGPFCMESWMSSVMTFEQPSFLNGTFIWDRRGYTLAGSPSLDLLSSTALDSDNPWIAISATLEHAKVGDFFAVGDLTKWMQLDLGPTLNCAFAELFGDTASCEDLGKIESMIVNGPDHARMAACRAAYWSGLLWLIPLIVDCWKRVKWRDDRDEITVMLSDLLEEDAGPIVANEAFSAEEYADLILGCVDEIQMKGRNQGISIWEGTPYSVGGLAKKMYALVTCNTIAVDEFEDDFIDYRHKFEAATGIECSSFFVDDELRPLAAAVVLEDFLIEGHADHYENGARYFFGHRIP